jgi:hypothetical protein
MAIRIPSVPNRGVATQRIEPLCQSGSVSGGGLGAKCSLSALVREFGVDLEDVEERVRLRRGELLLLDNVRVVHGRIGQRPQREVWQILFGLPDLNPPSVDRIVEAAAIACS